MTSPRRAFTLIEFLIVVSMIAVLAAIAVPNFLDAQIRSKLARTRIDMASVGVALRAYYADFDRYPLNDPATRQRLEQSLTVPPATPPPPPGPKDLEMMLLEGNAAEIAAAEAAQNQPPTGQGATNQPIYLPPGTGHDLTVLTTPIAFYSGLLPVDPFRQAREAEPFVYFNLSDLPTTSTGNRLHGHLRRYVLLSTGPDTGLTPDYLHPVVGPYLPYDPTNGLVSKGDIVDFGQ